MFTKAFVSLSPSKKIAYLAIFTAACVGINSISILVTPSITLSFNAAFGFLAGGILGPVGGFSVMFLGDLLGCFTNIFNIVVPNPLVCIASGLLGLIPGLIMTHVRGNFYLRGVLSFFLCLLVCSAGVNTFAIYIFYSSRSVSYWAYLLTRMPAFCIVMAVNCVIGVVLAKIINKVNGKFRIS
ncbi:MAG TPA: ECF transporter S component [Candidatus Borkfalkia excrementavium]|uniref:ECF transporter S component n=1 Tax=Candidatus Borkfalkia excrementavium TaxID=2838505 RepID=A0A9D1Z7Z4_9FIRM|nr:ECF transporter S component [Candidatus Borkfalkia excrementavium]